MKYTIKYQKNAKVFFKKIEVSQTLEFEEVSKEFPNIIDIKEHNKERNKIGIKNRKKEMFLFFKQLHLMLQSHLSFNEALELILETNINKEIKTIITILQNAVIQNYPIDIALDGYQKSIGKLPIMFLKQGLQNGTIKTSIHSIVILLEQELEINKKLSEKLQYPVFLILSLISSISLIFIYVIPSFEFIFNSLGDQLPLATEILLIVNKIFTNYWYIAVFIASGFLLISLFIMKKYRFFFDKLIFSLPILGSTIIHYQLYKLFLSLYINTESKYQFQTAISNSIEIITNLYLQDIIKKIQTGIKNGENIAELFSRFSLFDQIVVKLLYTAENTGAYALVLKDITNYYKENFNQKLQKLTSVIEPFIISIIAFIVLWLVLAVMVPIWELSAVGL